MHHRAGGAPRRSNVSSRTGRWMLAAAMALAIPAAAAAAGLDASYFPFSGSGTWQFTNGVSAALVGTDGSYSILEIQLDGVPRVGELQ